MNTTKGLAIAVAVVGLTVAAAPAASASTTATKTTTTKYTQVCQTVGPLGQRSFPATVTVVSPTAVKKGAQFSTTTTIKLTIPGSVNSAAYALGAREQRTTLDSINVLTNNTTKPSKDITGDTSVKAARTPVPNGADTKIAFPAIASKFTAGTGAGSIKAKTGAINGSFQLFSAAGTKLGGPQPLQCAGQSVIVATVPVS